jgi:Arabinose-binding domain of AraC transcription regulator, N-term
MLAQPTGRIPWEALARLLTLAAERTACPHFGLLAGREWRLSDLGLLGELVRNSSTVDAALHELVANQHLNSEGALAFLLRQGDAVDLGYAIYVPFAESTRQIYDAVLAGRREHHVRPRSGPTAKVIATLPHPLRALWPAPKSQEPPPPP